MDLLDLFSDDSSSSEDDIIEIYLPRRIPSRIQNFLENTIPNYTNKEFQADFRITREAFDNLVIKLTPYLIRAEGSVGKMQIPVERQLLSVLWLLATPDSYRSVGSRFNMGKSSLFACFCRVVIALNNISSEIIKWPSRAERVEIKRQFENMENLSGVVEAIDGTYVPIKAPRENAQVYINRKCFYGMTLQCICTPELKFTDCFTGFPSSVSDARIFRNSDIFLEFNNNNNDIYFEEDEFIIGDKAYPVRKWCIPPYIEQGHVTQRQLNFNSVHAKTRQVIERSFALLFGRFRRLRYLDMNRTDMIPATIIACCVLHNICLLHPDVLMNDYIEEGRVVINNINDMVQNNPNRNANNQPNQNEGVLRRNLLAANL